MGGGEKRGEVGWTNNLFFGVFVLEEPSVEHQ